MFVTIEVNGKKIRAEKGETILNALNSNGINIPTLCRMKGLSPTGACRICVVEVEGFSALVTACSQPVAEWMKIRTHSPRVLSARKTIVELLLASHPHDCLSCERNLVCELQKLAFELNIREKQACHGPRPGRKGDMSSMAIVREPVKCIVCGRCVRICDEQVGVGTYDFLSKGEQTHIGVAMDLDLNLSGCIFCGQCVKACPTGALHEKSSITEVQDHLYNEKILCKIEYSPLVAYGVAEELGIKFTPGFEKTLNSALKSIGFNRVYSTGTGTDVMLTELAAEVVQRKPSSDNLPLFSSHCPAWVKYAEQALPDLVANITTLKTPQRIAGAIARISGNNEADNLPGDDWMVSVSPCLASKFDARREGSGSDNRDDVDSVLTVRELLSLLKLYGIDLANSGSVFGDEPMSLRSSLADITEMSGGLVESIARIISVNSGGAGLTQAVIRKFRSAGSFRELSFKCGESSYRFALVDGLNSLETLFASIQKGIKYDFVEVTACRGGCADGGGIGYSSNGDKLRERQKAILKNDEQAPMEIPAKNPEISKLYSAVLKGREADIEKILRQNYKQRKVLL